MTVALRAALLFALGLAVGLAWVEWRGGSRPFGAGATDSGSGDAPAVGAGLGTPPALDGPLPGPDWGRIVVRASTGRPLPPPADPAAPAIDGVGPASSGADDRPIPPLPMDGEDERDGPAPWLAPDEPDPAGATADVELVVPDGSSLSMVVWRHYGTAPATLVRAVALYNGIDDPDSVRAGQLLRLPPRASLDER